jgi:hypothetical protein
MDTWRDTNLCATKIIAKPAQATRRREGECCIWRQSESNVPTLTLEKICALRIKRAAVIDLA